MEELKREREQREPPKDEKRLDERRWQISDELRRPSPRRGPD